jgi:hypothetical protein
VGVVSVMCAALIVDFGGRLVASLLRLPIAHQAAPSQGAVVCGRSKVVLMLKLEVMG